MKEEEIKGTLRTKVEFFSFLFVMIILLGLSQTEWFSQLFYTDTSTFSDVQLRAFIEKRSDNIIIYNTVFLLFNIGMAYFSYKLGRKIHINNQFPPPGTRVPFTMKVRRGRKALNQAYSAYMVALILVASGTIIFIYGIKHAYKLIEIAQVI